MWRIITISFLNGINNCEINFGLIRFFDENMSFLLFTLSLRARRIVRKLTIINYWHKKKLKRAGREKENHTYVVEKVKTC